MANGTNSYLDFDYGDTAEKEYYTLYARVAPASTGCNSPTETVTFGSATATGTVNTVAELVTWMTSTTTTKFVKIGELEVGWGIESEAGDTIQRDGYTKTISKNSKFMGTVTECKPQTIAAKEYSTEDVGNLGALLDLDQEFCDFIMVNCSTYVVHVRYRHYCNVTENFKSGEIQRVSFEANREITKASRSTYCDDITLDS